MNVTLRLMALMLLLTSIFACRKDSFDAKKQAATDEALIKAFIVENKLDMTRHPSGLYYKVITEGENGNIAPNATVTVSYEGRLLNGNVFEKTPSATFPLNRVIEGWTIGVPFAKIGGRVRLLIPSGLAYGNNSPGGGIPRNAVLDFTIDVHHAQ